MKMKRVTLGFSILALSTAFVLSCKPEKDVPPVADTEVQSAVYASWANYVITDIETACCFMAENSYEKTFYSAYPASGTTVVVTRDTIRNSDKEEQLVMSFNQTKCMDGNIRTGSIFMYVKVEDGKNNRYSRDFGWRGRIKFSTYKINGWLVELFNDDAPVYLYNTLPSETWSPASTKITWRFAGKLKFTHPTDPSKNMVWDGELFKTLENTSDPKVFPVSKQGAINWFLAKVSYSGHFEGTGPRGPEAKDTMNVSYAMKINKETPLLRDFQCSPDKITGVALTPTVGSLEQRGDEHHPFKTGIASFTVGTDYPRQIYYGNEGEPQLDLQCDETGEVMIKGISYRINFMR